MSKATDKNSPEALQALSHASERARTALEFLQECVPIEKSDHFWKIIIAEVLKERVVQKLISTTPSMPMSNKEAAAFARKTMEEGKKYVGIPIGDVPLKYLDWFLSSGEEFKRDLVRYMSNETIREKLREELDAD